MTPDYPDAVMTPASTSNYRPANRPADNTIDLIVIHDIEGTAISTVHWFQNPKAQATSHYIIAADGTIYQAVKEHDIAWHAGNRNVNNHAIGIEHEGYAYRPGFYNWQEYEASAKLVRTLTTRYNIPRDRTHIIGHFEVPDLVHPGKFGGASGHTDPGPWWDWDSYMVLLRNDAKVTTPVLPTVLHPGETASFSVSFTNLGDDAWPSPTAPAGADRSGETDFAIKQRERGIVYLGAWSPDTAPMPPASPFFGAGWTSPRLVAPVAADTANGAEASFNVTLHGPRTLGAATQSFRLYKMPIAPHMPVAFGPTLTATIDVQPWDIRLDPTAPANSFSAIGWNRKEPAAPGGTPLYWLQTPKSAAVRAPQNAPAAVWQQKLPISGEYDVYARWTPGASRTSHAVYTIQSAPSPAAGAASAGTPAPAPPTVAVDQRKDGGAWKLLGRFPFDTNSPALIGLSALGSPGSVVVADGVRFVGPFPAPPGAASASAPIPFGSGPRP
jgi:hypothetical protein